MQHHNLFSLLFVPTRHLWLLCAVMLCVSSCYYPAPQLTDQWDQTEDMRDSIVFASSHHYSPNFNFFMTGDSLQLCPHLPLFPTETDVPAENNLTVYNGNRLVVADIAIVPEDPTDSVWVQVARDQYTIGWVHENELLSSVVPDDSISLFIHIFSDHHLWYFAGTLLLLLLVYLIRRMRLKRFSMVHFDDINSFYPTLLCIVLSTTATLYASIQKFVPQTWTEFYFHPTLNPFGVPLILGLFLVCVWLIVLLSIATVEDVWRQLSLYDGLLYLFALLGMLCVCYLFFSLATLYFVGYPALLLYAGWAVWRYIRHSRCSYTCGNCGDMIHTKGICPHCGTANR